MNEHTEQNINEAIDWLQQTGGQIQDFATTQAPLYCQEVVAWTFWMGIICCGFAVVLLAIAATIGLKLPRWFKEDDYDGSFRTVAGVIVCILAPFIAAIILTEHLGNTIKAKVAPRIVIVEHLRGLNK